MPRSFVRIVVGEKGLYRIRVNQISSDCHVRNVIKLILNILIIGIFLRRKLAISRLLKN